VPLPFFPEDLASNVYLLRAIAQSTTARAGPICASLATANVACVHTYISGVPVGLRGRRCRIDC